MIAERIEAPAADEGFYPNSLSTNSADTFKEIGAGDTVLISAPDAGARLESAERGVVVKAVQLSIAQGLRFYREERSPRHLLEHCVRAVISAALRVVGLSLLRRLLRRAGTWLEHRYGVRLTGIQIKQFAPISAEQLWVLAHRFVMALR